MKRVMGILMTMIMTLGLCAGAGAAEEEITVVSREAGSGTRSAFVELTGVEHKDESGEKVDDTYEEAIIQNGTAQVLTTVRSDPNAIGYISLGSLNETVKALRVNDVEATAEHVADGSYALARPFNIAVKGEPNATAADFIAWMLGEEGQRIAGENGYVPGEAAPYAAAPVAGKIVVGGSSSVGPLMEKLAEAYQAAYPQVEIEVQVSDSTTGMKSAISGVYDIGMASREVKESEKAEGLTAIRLCMDGIAVIVNTGNPLESLSVEQVRQIFTGEAMTWDQIK